jgi:hypothetical protein
MQMIGKSCINDLLTLGLFGCRTSEAPHERSPSTRVNRRVVQADGMAGGCRGRASGRVQTTSFGHDFPKRHPK